MVGRLALPSGDEAIRTNPPLGGTALNGEGYEPCWPCWLGEARLYDEMLLGLSKAEMLEDPPDELGLRGGSWVWDSYVGHPGGLKPELPKSPFKPTGLAVAEGGSEDEKEKPLKMELESPRTDCWDGWYTEGAYGLSSVGVRGCLDELLE